jgi:hypothetical protein
MANDLGKITYGEFMARINRFHRVLINTEADVSERAEAEREMAEMQAFIAARAPHHDDGWRPDA